MSVRILTRWLRLPYQRQLLVLEAFSSLVLAMLLVRCVPFRYWSPRLADPGAAEALPIDEPLAPVAREVSSTIRRLDQTFGYRFTCLMQAIAGKWMLNRRGIANTLVLGVCTERDANASMVIKAHAWLCSGSAILLGGESHQQFTPISQYHSMPKPRPSFAADRQQHRGQVLPIKGKPQ